MKYLAIAMGLAVLTFFSLDKLGFLGDSYGVRSGALHIIFLVFGWLGYQFELADSENKEPRK